MVDIILFWSNHNADVKPSRNLKSREIKDYRASGNGSGALGKPCVILP